MGVGHFLSGALNYKARRGLQLSCRPTSQFELVCSPALSGCSAVLSSTQGSIGTWLQGLSPVALLCHSVTLVRQVLSRRCRVIGRSQFACVALLQVLAVPPLMLSALCRLAAWLEHSGTTARVSRARVG